jgi:hypothetical protein
VVASSSRRSPWVRRASPRDETRCGGAGVATGRAARCLLGIGIVCADASGAFSRARVAASHTGVRQSGGAAVERSVVRER